MKIDNINLTIIPDSRGKDTLEAEMFGDSNRVGAAVPSGKSTGKSEAFVLEPKKALEKFQEIKNKILSEDFKDQKEFDDFLINLDGNPSTNSTSSLQASSGQAKSNLGGNLILALSLAFARLKAKEERLELYEYIKDVSGFKFQASSSLHPIFNVINGGAHAKNKLDFQEFQVIPMVNDFGMAIVLGREFYRKLGELLENKFGKNQISLGDEAGYSAPFKSNEEAIEILSELIAQKSYPMRIGLDIAATQFCKVKGEGGKEKGIYEIGEKEYSAEELIEKYLKLIESYNILSIEDPFCEDDFSSFAKLTAELRGSSADQYGLKKQINADKIRVNPSRNPSESVLVIADDLTTTNPKLLKKAIEQKSGNAIFIKLNQIGTLTETLEVVKMAYKNNWEAIVSHRSGETLDDFIADLAVGINAWGLKSGAPAKLERMNKYNRVLEILNIKN